MVQKDKLLMGLAYYAQTSRGSEPNWLFLVSLPDQMEHASSRLGQLFVE
jgi:hypothetical protein